jgi:hypothetical protein
MKIFLSALCTLSLATGAFAQKSAYSANAKNYSVCYQDNRYRICDGSASVAAPAAVSTISTSASTSITTRGRNISFTSPSRRARRSGMRVIYDTPNGPYEGNEILQNDGVSSNKERNLNQYNDAVHLPPSDGSVSRR